MTPVLKTVAHYLRAKLNIVSKRWHSKSKLQTTVVQGAAFIVASVLCGLVIAHYHRAPTLTNKDLSPVMPVAAEPKPAVSENTQNNPLFSTNPSWSQNFSSQKSGLLDPRYWNVLVGPAENSNDEQQYYTDSPANLRIEDGALRLIATNHDEPGGYKYGSARIETQNKQSFKYGRIDIVAKLPKGVGTWPAVWLLPANDTYAQKSPASNPIRYKNGGEIDVIEAVGFEPDVSYGVAHTVSDLTRRSDGTGSNATVQIPNSTTTFNKYTLLWTPTTLTFALNDKPYYTYTRQNGADYTTWPFDQPFYLIANLAMGGSWGGLDTTHFPGNGIDNSALPASLDIRSIDYYSYIGK